MKVKITDPATAKARKLARQKESSLVNTSFDGTINIFTGLSLYLINNFLLIFHTM